MDKQNQVVDVEKIKNLCELRGMPLAEFGRRIGLNSRELISRRLKNQYKISGDELILMARELNVSVEDLALG